MYFAVFNNCLRSAAVHFFISRHKRLRLPSRGACSTAWRSLGPDVAALRQRNAAEVPPRQTSDEIKTSSSCHNSIERRYASSSVLKLQSYSARRSRQKSRECLPQRRMLAPSTETPQPNPNSLAPTRTFYVRPTARNEEGASTELFNQRLTAVVWRVVTLLAITWPRIRAPE